MHSRRGVYGDARHAYLLEMDGSSRTIYLYNHYWQTLYCACIPLAMYICLYTICKCAGVCGGGGGGMCVLYQGRKRQGQAEAAVVLTYTNLSRVLNMQRLSCGILYLFCSTIGGINTYIRRYGSTHIRNSTKHKRKNLQLWQASPMAVISQTASHSGWI